MIIYFPKENFDDRIAIPKNEEEVVENVIELETKINEEVETDESIELEKPVLYHYIQEGETLGIISTFYPDVSLSEIKKLNNFFGEIKLESGTKLKVKEL